MVKTSGMRITILVSLSLLGCKQATVREILDEAASESAVIKVEAGNHLITARYVPPEALLLSRAGLERDVQVTDQLLDSLRNSEGLSGWTFLLTISPRNPSTPGSLTDDVVYGANSGFANYQEAMAAYNFGLREKVWIESGETRIPLSNYQMENTFGMSPARNFTLTFSALEAKPRHKIKLVLDAIVPGMQREKLAFEIRTERYATSQ